MGNLQRKKLTSINSKSLEKDKEYLEEIAAELSTKHGVYEVTLRGGECWRIEIKFYTKYYSISLNKLPIQPNRIGPYPNERVYGITLFFDHLLNLEKWKPK